MKILTAATTALILTAFTFPFGNAKKVDKVKQPEEQKIQAAILLDVSGSMGGLIEQAKAQLWNMVTVMGKAKCPTGNPKIEIALYEYGRSTNDAKAGFIRQISPFTSDLDNLSAELFKLTINGSEEYCGQVIYKSLDELNWDMAPSNYKVIFIAGNEEFLQGTVHYTKACAEANKKGVIVNTIYCGDRLQGIKEHWDLAGECGSGSYTNINQNATIDDIPTPYDSTLVVLNNKLNGTYVYYGEVGVVGYSRQASMDKANMKLGASTQAKRTTAKANPQLYSNAGWDLVDAVQADSLVVNKIQLNTLHDSLRTKSREELKEVIAEKSKERGAIQAQIRNVVAQRQQFINTEKARAAATSNEATLETEVEKIIRTQVKRYKMTIE